MTDLAATDLVAGADPEDLGFTTRPDFYAVLAALRATEPVHEYAPGCWAVSRYDDVRAISRDPERFCSSRGVLVHDPLRDGRPGATAGSIIHMDPPEHGRYRSLVNRRFTPRAVAGHESQIRGHARRLLDAVPRGEVVDAVTALTTPFPVLVIADLLGVHPRDRARFVRSSDAAIEAADDSNPKILEALAGLFQILSREADLRREAPTDDLMSVYANAEIDGRPLTREEVIVSAMTILVAGNETTRHLLSGTLLALSEHPDQRARLAADPSTIPAAVEECLRWVTPIQTFARTATADVEVAGRRISAGDYLVMLYASANRDEAVFGPTAADFDVTRPTLPPHLAFGFGEHVCLGAALARLEARVFLEELLARAPDYEIAGDPVMIRSTLVRGMTSLPVVLPA